MPQPTARRARRGVTMLEIAIVVSIVGIMTAIGASYLSPMLPSWRTRRAANEFASRVELARQAAIANGTTYRIRIEITDPDLDGTSTNVGTYSVAEANPDGSPVQWDVLPTEDGGVDDEQGDEGWVDFSIGTSSALAGVSIQPFGDIKPDDRAILIDSRGFLANGSPEFGPGGTIDVTFVNKPARQRGTVDDWTVCVSRSGMTRISSSRNPGCTGTSGTPETTTSMTTSGGGFTDDASSGFGTSTGGSSP